MIVPITPPPKQVGVTPDVAFKRAIELQQRGDLAGSEKNLSGDSEAVSKHFETLANLGSLLLFEERLEEAVRFLRRALKQKPNSAIVHNLLARVLYLLDRHEEALQRANHAIALDPQFIDARATLAQGLAELGRYDEALAAMAQAIELAPDQARLYYSWGEITRWTSDDPHLAALEKLAQKPASLPLDDQVNLNFALGKAYADCGDIERAFRHQIDGAALQRRLLKYDEASTLYELESMSALDAKWIARHQRVGDPSPLPIFILGMPRSGTSLVEQILASHPKVKALGERVTLSEAIAGACGTTSIPPLLPQRAAHWSDVELHRLGARYIKALAAPCRQARPASQISCRQTSGLPASFTQRCPTRASFTSAATPSIPAFRSSRYFFSGHSQLYSYDLRELGRYYRAYEKVMAHWRNVLPPGVMLEVQYEEVVDNLEQQARQIIAHCGLEWNDACLEFYKAERPVRTISHAQVRQPIYRSSIGRPRPPRNLLLPLLEALGVARRQIN